jgi:hypothetical protein
MRSISRMAAAILCVTATAALAATDAPVEAVWKTQRVDFVYWADSSFYTCEGLRTKLRAILKSVGARDNLIIRVSSACGDMSFMIPVQITIQSPVEATEVSLQELTNHTVEDELIARVRNERLATVEDLPRFNAVVKEISFARDRSLRLAEGDCELVRQVRQQILPLLAVRVLYADLHCSPTGNVGRPRLTVAALVAAPDVTIE